MKHVDGGDTQSERVNYFAALHITSSSVKVKLYDTLDPALYVRVTCEYFVFRIQID